MIASVLEQKYCVFKTAGNYNTNIGMPLMAAQMTRQHDVAVLEMGMNSFGEIHNLSIAAKPNIAVITNVGVAHIEMLGDRDGILKAKSEIFVEKAIERGVFAKHNTQTLFIPISQLDTKFVEKTENYVGKNLEVYIKELDTKKNRIVATHREVLQERLDKEREERRARIKAEKEAERARIKAEKEAHIAKVKAEKEELFNSFMYTSKFVPT